MALKKSQLYTSLWQSCDELRGGMDASQYKDYVLFMLFIKYISDKYADSDDFAPPVTIPPGASFADMVELKGKSDSRVIAKVIGISPKNTVAATTAYDPTCGSGSLLLKVAAEAGRHITLEGQEKDVTTAGLARMNMILHDFPTANILSGNTLAAPKFKDGEQLRTYDFVVANPPFSDKTWSTGLTPGSDPYQRFTWGEPPAKQGDYAYLLHIIRSMKSSGKAACILPHGVLFRGNAEAVIRKKLVRSGYLKGIIGLPANLFYGTGIPACIIVLDKENSNARKGIFMIDASKGFLKDGNKNRLREQDIHRIVDSFHKQTEVPRFARMVPIEEIASDKNDYNLNLPRYIDSTEPEDIQDIDGHLRGGIPDRDLDALAAYWQVLPSVRKVLFKSAGRPGYSQLRLPIAKVTGTVTGLRLSTTRDDVVRSCIEGITYEMLDMMNDEEAAGVEVKSLKLTGGATKSPLWCQMQADIYQKPVSIVQTSENGCLGAAMFAGIGTGVYKDAYDAVAQAVHTTRSYEPNPALKDVYHQAFERFAGAYQGLNTTLFK